MKFLVDRCAGRRLTDWLITEGYDASYCLDLGADPGDAELLHTARDQGRILVTIDADFGRLIFREAAAHCGVIRLPDVLVERRIDLMRELLRRHAMDLERGAIVTVRGGADSNYHVATRRRVSCGVNPDIWGVLPGPRAGAKRTD